MDYTSDIVIGEQYEHTRTGLVGYATAIYFFENACERVNIEYLHDGEVKKETFDAVELRSRTDPPVAATSERPGGARGPSSPPRR